MRRLRVVAAAGIVVIGAGVLAWQLHGSGRPSHVADLRDACAGKAFGDVAAYSGPAPHPVAIFLAAHGHDFSHAKPETTNDVNPTKEIAPYESRNPSDVQLVACGVITSEARSGPDCKFTDPDSKRSFSVPLHSATYSVTVYALRTHREVGQVTVATTPDFGIRCPLLLDQAAAPDRYLDHVDINQWIEKLDKYVR